MLEQRLQRETAGAETGGVAAAIAPALRSVAHGAFTRLPVAIRLWDGSCLGAGTSREAPTLEIRSPRALQYLLSAPGELGLGRAWVAGDLEIDGDIESLLSWRRRYRDVKLSALDRLRIVRTATAVAGRSILRPAPKLAAEAHPHGRVHSLRRDRAAISHHYDVSNDFYGIVLGPSMVYSCAYFDSAADTLEAAQARKLDLICRKLALRPGDQLLDIGCGWGSLIIPRRPQLRRHGARHHALGPAGAARPAAHRAGRAAGQLRGARLRLPRAHQPPVRCDRQRRHVRARRARPDGRLRAHRPRSVEARRRLPEPRDHPADAGRRSAADVHQPLRLPGRRAAPAHQRARGDVRGRPGGPRRGVAARALHADAAPLGAEPRARLRSGGAGRRRGSVHGSGGST